VPDTPASPVFETPESPRSLVPVDFRGIRIDVRTPPRAARLEPDTPLRLQRKPRACRRLDFTPTKDDIAVLIVNAHWRQRRLYDTIVDLQVADEYLAKDISYLAAKRVKMSSDIARSTLDLACEGARVYDLAKLL
jgi:hypothetical protein